MTEEEFEQLRQVRQKAQELRDRFEDILGSPVVSQLHKDTVMGRLAQARSNGNPRVARAHLEYARKVADMCFADEKMLDRVRGEFKTYPRSRFKKRWNGKFTIKNVPYFAKHEFMNAQDAAMHLEEYETRQERTG